MSEPVAIISSSQIKQDEFINLLQSLGAFIIEDSNDPFDARLSRGYQHVWIALDNRGFDQFEDDEIELFTQMLTSKPQSHIVLEISREAGSQQLAVELACVFAERWPCIVDNCSDKVFTSQELFDLRSSGGDLW